jgi:hypothetical protein
VPAATRAANSTAHAGGLPFAIRGRIARTR